MIIANIGATNPHIVPSSVSIQQLCMYVLIMTGYYVLYYSTNNSSCPYWSWTTPVEIATIGTGMPNEIYKYTS